jgi:hypothetical protein
LRNIYESKQPVNYIICRCTSEAYYRPKMPGYE